MFHGARDFFQSYSMLPSQILQQLANRSYYPCLFETLLSLCAFKPVAEKNVSSEQYPIKKIKMKKK